MRMKSGKKMTLKERKSALALLQTTSKKLCPFEQQYSRCNDLNCAFLHQNKSGRAGCGRENYRKGDILSGVVQMWNWNQKEERGYGFVKDGDG